MLSTFDIFKIGIGPSSSHTMGPMLAAARFVQTLAGSGERIPGSGPVAGITVRLHGSLAFTGKGHATDRATILGLAGFTPEAYDAQAAEETLAGIGDTHRLALPGLGEIVFDPERDVIFDYGRPLPGHTNGMVLTARDAEGNAHTTETFYSIGGGFIATARELERGHGAQGGPDVPHPFRTAADLLAICRRTGAGIAEIQRRNDAARHTQAGIDEGLRRIWETMAACIRRGLETTGTLPGGLDVRRRAPDIHAALMRERGTNLVAPHAINDWILVHALAVNEENAAGGQIVTAPTNGAAGVLPATIRYWLDHVPGAREAQVPTFLLTAAAIGALIKTNASISGAEVGCQGEVGSAAAMSAAGLAAVLGGAPDQVENAAEIALEHHLGMTCDPVAGLVQIPCIERNGLGAIKAVSAASLALRGDGAHMVSLDACIETMRQTGRDMSEKYKETSLGGLAVNVPAC